MSDSQNFKFDKFMEDINKRQTERLKRAKFVGKNSEETPQRKLARRIREHWQHRIHWQR